MEYDVYIDHSRCSGCGSCVELCPQVFAWDDAHDKVIVVEQGAADAADLESAAVTCPQDCIELERTGAAQTK